MYSHIPLREWPYGFLDLFWRNFPESMPPEDIDRQELIDSVEYVLADCDLDERQKTILHQRFKDQMNYSEIGKLHGISGERVRQLIVYSMRPLWKNIEYSTILSVGIRHYDPDNVEQRVSASPSQRRGM